MITNLVNPDLFRGVQIQRRDLNNTNICATGSLLVRLNDERYTLPNFECLEDQINLDSLYPDIKRFAAAQGIEETDSLSYVRGYVEEVVHYF